MKFAVTIVTAFLACAAPSAVAHEFFYNATLTGAPGTNSPATGHVSILLDLDLITMDVNASFANLSGPTTGAHVRGLTPLPLTGTAGVASQSPTLSGFPIGVTSGTYAATIDLTQAAAYDPTFITDSGGTVSDALNALIFGMAEGKMYFEIGTIAAPQGEVSGFLVSTPEPACAAALGVAACFSVRTRRTRSIGPPSEL